ncbi:YfiR family protein [Acinetobacter baylyi]|uniref:YfiR family protein n=1 Tax=Acinetobacter baylyi TaxID=202950 RepID=UPI000370E858|nr:YfiR family protein [Acinetobacter baylyi]KAF2370119.1 hypothetical protein BSL88_13610 [Acinetobacter baylyi]KAF2375973.1 hypothetical protein BSL67_01495 [Acinetobacter baylyi]KAF2377531.1 hypothetical protein BSN81_09285 [Acinetobacter baylyi]KAF2383163.1 hypothetical protein BSN83_00005 [Acinetobacter baylyi]KAF2386089.1 hypothetical protein BSN82_01500 [Acinetobacter baylyi]
MHHKFFNRLFLLSLLYIFTRACFASPIQNFYALTLSIMSYSKWPADNVPTLCIIDNPTVANSFQSQVKQQSYSYKIQAIPASSFSKTQCQAVYFSNLSPQQQQNLINSYPTRNVLSFSSNNSDCEIGSIFCLYQQKGNATFKVNLDSLSRSQIRIDPRVLLLAKNAE